MLIKLLNLYLALQTFLLGDPLTRLERQSRGSKPISHDVWDHLLQKHVQNGKVDYRGLQEDRHLLQQYLDLLSQNPPHPRFWSVSERLAYWINAYNAFTVELVLRYYPLDSIKKLGSRLQLAFVNSAWDLRFFSIGGQKMTLNVIEHQILRRHFDEPRIHFAINCASFSCPRLREEAFTGDDIEAQLDDQARDFVNDPDKNRVSAAGAELSMIFQWYAGDFSTKQPLWSYINQFATAQLNEKTPISYIPYDWSLNEL